MVHSVGAEYLHVRPRAVLVSHRREATSLLTHQELWLPALLDSLEPAIVLTGSSDVVYPWALKLLGVDRSCGHLRQLILQGCNHSLFQENRQRSGSASAAASRTAGGTGAIDSTKLARTDCHADRLRLSRVVHLGGCDASSSTREAATQASSVPSSVDGCLRVNPRRALCELSTASIEKFFGVHEVIEGMTSHGCRGTMHGFASLPFVLLTNADASCLQFSTVECHRNVRIHTVPR